MRSVAFRLIISKSGRLYLFFNLVSPFFLCLFQLHKVMEDYLLDLTNRLCDSSKVLLLYIILILKVNALSNCFLGFLVDFLTVFSKSKKKGRFLAKKALLLILLKSTLIFNNEMDNLLTAGLCVCFFRWQNFRSVSAN